MVIWNSPSRPRQINVDQSRPKQVAKVIKVIVPKVPKTFWYPRCYQHLWCLYCTCGIPFSQHIQESLVLVAVRVPIWTFMALKFLVHQLYLWNCKSNVLEGNTSACEGGNINSAAAADAIVQYGIFGIAPIPHRLVLLICPDRRCTLPSNIW